MNTEPDRPECHKDLAAAQARIHQLEGQLDEAEQELKAASEIIEKQDTRINDLTLLMDLEAATRRHLERRLAELEDAKANELAEHRPLSMAVVEKHPFWFDRFKRLVEKCWSHHGPCKSLHLSSALEVESGLWLFRAAPVFQEVLGGKDDGKTVWTGFEFHTDKLMRGMTVYGVSAKSCCPECNPTPTITIRGSYRGHMLTLTILLEPVPGSPVVEIIDTLKHQIRSK